jgi:hypothetical protein
MTASAATPHATTSNGALRPAILTFGPLLTLVVLAALVSNGDLVGRDLTVWSAGAAVLWSPLPISVPAVLLDHERDTALTDVPWLRRAVLLMPWLMFSSRSAARSLATRSMVSFGALVIGLLVISHAA